MPKPLKVYIEGVKYEPVDDQGPEVPESAPEFNAATFYDAIRAEVFGGSMNQGQVEGVNLIGATCLEMDLDPFVTQSAYVLATVFWETARTMQPIEEYGGRRKRYAPWYGRGHVQLTWEENYRKQQQKLGAMQVVRDEKIPYQVHDNKKLALNPETSALICVGGMRDGDFTGKKLGDYITDASPDYVGARRIVNGTDKAQIIAQFAVKFEDAIRAGMKAGHRE